MKSLAQARVHQFAQAAEGSRSYFETVWSGFRALLTRAKSIEELSDPVEEPPRKGFILIGSDQGLCGSFNRQLVEYGQQQTQEFSRSSTEPSRICSVGYQIEKHLQIRGISSAHHLRTPATKSGILNLVNDLVILIEKWRAESSINRIDLIYNEGDDESIAPCIRQLLPLTSTKLRELEGRSWGSHCIPKVWGPFEEMRHHLRREYIFASLYRSCAQSVAAENERRLNAMRQAERNIDEQTERLKLERNQARQNQITEELMEVVSGYESLREDADDL